MPKVEEVMHAYITTHCHIERDLVLTHYFHLDWEADIFVIDPQGISHEIEIKFSRADFYNDFKKAYLHPATGEKFYKHDKIKVGDYVGNYFSFLVPMGMLKVEEVPEHCGLIEFYHDSCHWEMNFRLLRPPALLHRASYWECYDRDDLLRKLALQLVHKKLQLRARDTELVLGAGIKKGK